MSFKKYSKAMLLIFLLVSILDIIGIFLDNSLLQSIFKPLIIPTLLIWYISKADAPNKWYMIALVFSFIGDVLLLDKMNLFIFGIGAFLITQVMYVFIFSKGLAASNSKNKLKSIIPFLLFYSILMAVLAPKLNDFLIPVVIYGIAISIFGVVALLNYLHFKKRITLTLLQGALLFIVSDSLIALNKFYEEQQLYPIIIMVTYIMAQYLIANYMLKSENNNIEYSKN